MPEDVPQPARKKLDEIVTSVEIGYRAFSSISECCPTPFKVIRIKESEGSTDSL